MIPDDSAVPVIDEQVLGMLHSGTAEAFPEIVQLFIHDAQQHITAIQQACIQEETTRLRKVIHSLKGSSRNLGAIALDELCQRIEQACATGDTAAVRTTISVLPEAYEKTRHALSRFCRR